MTPRRSPDADAAWLRTAAHELGFGHLAIAPAAEVEQHTLYTAWLQAGYAGELTYLGQDTEARRDPRRLLEGARSVVCVAVSYYHPSPPAEPAGLRGLIARYARAEDYHLVLKRRLNELGARAARELGADVAYRACVDSAPVLERALAARAGLGFQGKNTLLISPGVGSYTVLGELLLSIELPAGEPTAPRCGACRHCLDVCPTGALLDAYRLDARRCISYLTIEHKGHIAAELRAGMGNRIYGCDDCLAVCPWNKFAVASREVRFQARAETDNPPLAELLALDDAAFRKRFAGTPLKRTGRDRFVRNVVIAAGNSGNETLAPVVAALAQDGSALVRAMVAWAYPRLASRDEARLLASGMLARETDDGVAAELRRALDDLTETT